MIRKYEIESIMEDHDINYSYHPREDAGDRWLIIVPQGVIEISLSASREDLLFRTGPIVVLRDQEPIVRSRILRNAMDANDSLLIGRYVGSDEIFFEVPLSFPGSSQMTPEQFMRALMTTIGNLQRGPAELGMPAVEDLELPQAIWERLYPSS